MAFAIVYNCVCGERLQVYVPKRVAFGEWAGQIDDWLSVDAEEEAAGEIDFIRQASQRFGALFVDYREDDTCPACGGFLPLEVDFKRRQAVGVG